MSPARKTPFRPRKESPVTQNYNDGVVKIYTETDNAGSGYMPSPQRTLVLTLPYQERRLGFKRYYDAKQNQIHIERVIRVPNLAAVSEITTLGGITTQNVAETEDGNWFRIDLVQVVPDVFPPSVDLSFATYVQNILEREPIPPVNEGGGDRNA